jgi:hypothetical protein
MDSVGCSGRATPRSNNVGSQPPTPSRQPYVSACPVPAEGACGVALGGFELAEYRVPEAGLPPQLVTHWLPARWEGWWT